MATEHNTQDIVLARRRRNRRRRLQKLFLILLVLLLAGIIYARRDVWYPKLEGIGTRYQTIRQNDGREFPADGFRRHRL